MPVSSDQLENKLTKLPELENASVKFIDISHTVEKDMVTYKGIPGPLISDYRSREASRDYYADGTEFHIGENKNDSYNRYLYRLSFPSIS